MNKAASLPREVECVMTKKTKSQINHERLVEELKSERTHAGTQLVERMERCHNDWKDNRFTCRTPACFHCRRRYIYGEKRAVHRWFGHLENSDLAFVTAVVSATPDADALGPLIHKSRDVTRKRIAAFRKADDRWNGVYLAAWHEIDAVGGNQINLLPGKRRRLIEKIAPISPGSNRPAWITTWHGIIHLNGLATDDVACAFQQGWKLDGQVNVKPFKTMRSLRENLNRIASYCNKFTCSVTLSNFQTEPWPISWQSDFYSALHVSQRNAFEALRFTVNPKIITQDSSNSFQFRDALPHSISGVPMYDYTGRWL